MNTQMTSDKVKHSPLPLLIDSRSSCAVRCESGRMFASTAVHTTNDIQDQHAEENEANAAYIVKACNLFPELVEALELAMKLIRPEETLDYEYFEKIAKSILSKARGE